MLKSLVIRGLAAAAYLCCQTAVANTSNTEDSLLRVWRSSFENIPISNGDMGTMGLHLDTHPFRQLPSLYLGAGGYGGLTGEEGGFFTAGITLGQRFELTNWLGLDYGLHFGGGGGSRFTFPGGGMIVRPHAALAFRYQQTQLRLGLARTRFPNSTNPDNEDTHVFFGLSLLNRETLSGTGTRSTTAGHRFRGSASMHYYLTDDSEPLRRDGTFSGSNENQDIPLLGAKVEQFFNPNWFVGFETYGAGGGGADGFAAILLSLGGVTPLGSRFEWEQKLNLGMAGDGRLDTGGGLIGIFQTGLNFSLSRHWYLASSLGYMRAPEGKLAGGIVGLSLGWQADKAPMPKRLAPPSEIQTVAWSFGIGNKTYKPASNTQNKSGNPYDKTLDLIGFTISHPLNTWVSLQGSTHWAYGGNIGSYAEGLLGFSLHPYTSKGQTLRAKLSYEIGVGGGGVMELDGGLIHQATAGLEYRFSRSVSADLSLGRMQSEQRSFVGDVLMLRMTWHHSTAFLR